MRKQTLPFEILCHILFYTEGETRKNMSHSCRILYHERQKIEDSVPHHFKNRNGEMCQRFYRWGKLYKSVTYYSNNTKKSEILFYRFYVHDNHLPAKTVWREDGTLWYEKWYQRGVPFRPKNEGPYYVEWDNGKIILELFSP